MERLAGTSPHAISLLPGRARRQRRRASRDGPAAGVDRPAVASQGSEPPPRLSPDLLLEALAQLVRFRARLGEIADIDEPADLELIAVVAQPRPAPHPLHDLLERLRLQHPVAPDELLGLGER